MALIHDYVMIALPWVTKVFLACGGDFWCWPKAETSSAVGRIHERRSREKKRAGHYIDLTETGIRARQVSGTQGTFAQQNSCTLRVHGYSFQLYCLGNSFL